MALKNIDFSLLASYKRRRKILKEDVAAQLEETSNRVYVYKSNAIRVLPGLGKFYTAMFSASNQDKNIIGQGFKLSNQNTVFVRVLDTKGKQVQTLNFDWSTSMLYTFNIRYKIDYQKLVNWFNTQRIAGKIVSDFFTK